MSSYDKLRLLIEKKINTYVTANDIKTLRETVKKYTSYLVTLTEKELIECYIDVDKIDEYVIETKKYEKDSSIKEYQEFNKYKAIGMLIDRATARTFYFIKKCSCCECSYCINFQIQELSYLNADKELMISFSLFDQYEK